MITNIQKEGEIYIFKGYPNNDILVQVHLYWIIRVVIQNYSLVEPIREISYSFY